MSYQQNEQTGYLQVIAGYLNALAELDPVAVELATDTIYLPGVAEIVRGPNQWYVRRIMRAADEAINASGMLHEGTGVRLESISLSVEDN